jgi:hypothetical protein
MRHRTRPVPVSVPRPKEGAAGATCKVTPKKLANPILVSRGSEKIFGRRLSAPDARRRNGETDGPFSKDSSFQKNTRITSHDTPSPEAGLVRPRTRPRSARSCIQPCSSHSRMAPASCSTEVASPAAFGSTAQRDGLFEDGLEPWFANTSSAALKAVSVPHSKPAAGAGRFADPKV